MDVINAAQNVLVIYENKQAADNFVESLKDKTKGVINSKASTEILTSENTASQYDFIISGYDSRTGHSHDSSLFSAILKLLKPKGTLALRHIAVNNESASQLKLAGFVNVSEGTVVHVTKEEINALQETLNVKGDISIVEISCAKPSFEVGSSTKLSFAARPVAAPAVWKLASNLDDEQVDSIDPDTLLDDDDLKKPDPASLRVCGTTGKRKACKDCSCGLAEELDAEVKPAVDVPKSSCGSCYLGDAFRCASCPYLGMPAFKPGEKVQLAGNQLQSDI